MQSLMSPSTVAGQSPYVTSTARGSASELEAEVALQRQRQDRQRPSKKGSASEDLDALLARPRAATKIAARWRGYAQRQEISTVS